MHPTVWSRIFEYQFGFSLVPPLHPCCTDHHPWSTDRLTRRSRQVPMPCVHPHAHVRSMHQAVSWSRGLSDAIQTTGELEGSTWLIPNAVSKVSHTTTAAAADCNGECRPKVLFQSASVCCEVIHAGSLQCARSLSKAGLLHAARMERSVYGE
jgi:hypothetical protein